MKNLIEIPLNRTGKIYRSPMPFGKYDNNCSTFNEFQQNNISVIVMLVSDNETLEKSGRNLAELYRLNNIEIIKLPIVDFSVPDLQILKIKINQTINFINQNKNIAVHCNAGLGRTGMFLACLVKTVLSLSAKEAIKYVRKFVPGSIETQNQEAIIDNY